MRPPKGAKTPTVPTAKLEVMVDAKIVEALAVMEKYSKISKEELVTIALRRFISGHKDYLPEDYK